MISPALALDGIPASVGGGYNMWRQGLLVLDCALFLSDFGIGADLCLVIFNHLISSTWVDVPHGPKGYYFAENGEVEIED